MPEVARRASISARHSSTDRSTGWWSSNAASPVNESRMTWQGTPAMSARTWPRNRGGSARPSRASSSFASGPVTLIAARDIVRSMTWTRRPHVSIQSRSHISAFAAPPDVNVSVNRVSASRRIIPSSITWPRSLRSSAYRDRPGLMSATWHG